MNPVTAQVNGENINTVNVNIGENGISPQKKAEWNQESVNTLCKIYDSGNEGLIYEAMITLKRIVSQISDNTEKKTVTARITGTDHPAENLHCLRSMTEFMKASAIGIACDDGRLSRTEWDGFISMMTIISNDMRVIADNL